MSRSGSGLSTSAAASEGRRGRWRSMRDPVARLAGNAVCSEGGQKRTWSKLLPKSQCRTMF